MDRGVLGQAMAELLEVEHASGLVHPLSRSLDGRHQRQDAGDEDAGGHGEVGPSKRDPDGNIIQNRARSISRPATMAMVPRSQAGGVRQLSPSSSSRYTARLSTCTRAAASGSAWRAAPAALGRGRPAGPEHNRSSGRRSWRHSFPSRLAVRAISWSLASAACKRDFTVPTGILRISAISRYFKSW